MPDMPLWVLVLLVAVVILFLFAGVMFLWQQYGQPFLADLERALRKLFAGNN